MYYYYYYSATGTTVATSTTETKLPGVPKYQVYYIHVYIYYTCTG